MAPTDCLVEGCDRKHYCKGFCHPHYYRSRRGEAVEDMPPTIATRSRGNEGVILCGHTDRPYYAVGLCRSCYSTINNKPWRAANQKKLNRGARARRHGLSPAQLDLLIAKQVGRCGNPGCQTVIGEDHPDHRNGLQIDHDHATGQIRGLLCKPCNTALGHANDDPARLLGLVEYLRTHSTTA